MSNGLDPDKDGHSVSPDLGSNCLQSLKEDKKKKKKKKSMMKVILTLNLNELTLLLCPNGFFLLV